MAIGSTQEAEAEKSSYFNLGKERYLLIVAGDISI